VRQNSVPSVETAPKFRTIGWKVRRNSVPSVETAPKFRTIGGICAEFSQKCHKIFKKLLKIL